MKTFEIPVADGFVNTRAFFINLHGPVKVDLPVLAFLNSENGRFALKEPFVCNLDEGSGGMQFGDLLGERAALTVSQVCGILAHIGGGGWDLLDITSGQEEVNLLLGWISIDERPYVLYVEHEKEEGKGEEVHIHATTPDKKEDDLVLVLFPVLS